MLSLITATIDQREQAVELLLPELEDTSSTLGTLSGQLQQVGKAIDSGSMEPQTAVELIAQMYINLSRGSDSATTANRYTHSINRSS